MNKMRSILRLKISLMIFCAIAALAAPVFAEDAKPAPPAVSADDIKKALGMSIYLQGGYTYNGSASNGATQSSENDLRVFDHKANSFILDLAELVISRDTITPDSSGYKLKLSMGETTKWIHARGLSDAPLNQAQVGEGTDTFDLTEAYVSFMAPIGRGLRFDLGKMVTYFGAEVIEAIDDPDGFRTGTKQKLSEVTVTPEIRLSGGLIVRPEYRHDSSDKQSFDNGTKKSQDTVALGAMYRW